MRLIVLVLLALVASVLHATAQTPAVPTDSFAWEIDAGLTAASRYTYSLEMDGTLLQGPVPVVCRSSAPIAVCTTPIPSVTPGSHSVRVRLTDLVDGKPVSSDFSAPLVFTMIVLVPPRNLRVVASGTIP